MNIDYFCFTVPSLLKNDFIINHEDDENTIWIKTKDQELMDKASECNMLILFDRSTKKFYKDNVEYDITDKVIFPRSFIPYEEELLENIEKNGGISIQTNNDKEKITNWPKFIQPTHRKIITTTYGEFKENHEDYKKIFNKVFIKTAKKSHIHTSLGFYGVINFGDAKAFFTNPPLFNLYDDDTIFLTETFKSIADGANDMHCREYRVFVLNNNLLSISRSYVDHPTIIPDKVLEFANEQIEKTNLIKDFPSSYVLDIGEIMIDSKEVIDIIEYNPIVSSGLEVCHDLISELKQNNDIKKLIKK